MPKPYTFSFSYSRYSTWKDCPRCFHRKYIEKFEEPTSKALIEGRKVHDDAAKYLEGKMDLPDRLSRFSVVANALRDAPAKFKAVEKQFAFDRDKRPVQWFGPNAYFRFIWDAAIWNEAGTELHAIDWKTGKPYGSYADQMQVFAFPAFWTMPSLQTFHGHLAFLDTGDDDEYVITRDQLPDLERVWAGNIALFEADQAFVETPGCRWCKRAREEYGWQG